MKMEYHIVSSSSIDLLPVQVNKLLSQGWEPTGGPFQLHTVGFYGQALIRKSNNTNDNQQTTVVKVSPQDTRLFNALKEKRMELANVIGAPAYCVATNKSLQSMLEIKPKTASELLAVVGFGPHKVSQYGDVFLKVIAEHSS